MVENIMSNSTIQSLDALLHNIAVLTTMCQALQNTYKTSFTTLSSPLPPSPPNTMCQTIVRRWLDSQVANKDRPTTDEVQKLLENTPGLLEADLNACLTHFGVSIP
jgi:hypothetical protein